MNIIDGKKISSEIRAEAAKKASLLAGRGVIPGLAVILVGDNPASISYVTAKEKACAEVGIRSFPVRLPREASQEELLRHISAFNSNPDVHGILVQLPLPEHIDESAVISAISPEKDVDGFHPANVGKMLLGEDAPLPCTPHGIIELLVRCGVETSGKHAVVIGRSNIVGKPVACLLMRRKPGPNATVTVCHTGTKNLAEYTRCADIVIAAAGRPGTVTADMIKDGAVVIDVGVNRIPDQSRKSGFRLVGDVDFQSVAPKASLITPVPGGVGPMTIAMLMDNTVKSAERAARLN